MAYLTSLKQFQKDNIETLISTMIDAGITNPFTQAGILAVISKESSFNPAPEISYKNTPAKRIRSIFGSKLAGMSDAQIDVLKKDEVAFFNKVYGKRYGNDGYTSSGYKESWALPFKDGNDGWRYRGRGFNQITFKGNFKAVSDRIGVDLVNNPEKLSDPKIASLSAVSYFVQNFKTGFSPKHQAQYNSKDINSFTSLKDSVLAIYHCNAGFGSPMFTENMATSTGGLEKAIQRSPEFYTLVQAHVEKKKEES